MDDQLCVCGKRSKWQCPAGEVEVALLRVYYCVRQAPGEEAPLQVMQGWWCLQGGVAVELLTGDSILQMISQPRQQQAQQGTVTEYITQRLARTSKKSDSDNDTPEKVREATAAYITDRIDEALGGTRLNDQLWASSSSFLPGAAAEILDRINIGINKAVSGAMEQAFIDVGEPPDSAAVLSGIGAGMILAPISRPIAQAKKTIEVVGLFIAVLTLQPALAVACAKAIAHDEITSLIEKAIFEAASPVTKADTTKDPSEVVSSAAEAAAVKDASRTETAPKPETTNPLDEDVVLRVIQILLEGIQATEVRPEATRQITATDTPEDPPITGITAV